MAACIPVNSLCTLIFPKTYNVQKAQLKPRKGPASGERRTLITEVLYCKQTKLATQTTVSQPSLGDYGGKIYNTI
jgi:hypothetical protein